MQVQFEWEGKQWSGELRQISGAGNIYHLIVKGYYQGQLVRTETGWIFSNQKNGVIPELGVFFGGIIQGHTGSSEK